MAPALFRALFSTILFGAALLGPTGAWSWHRAWVLVGMAHDALGAHARDELGISAALQARPVQAALTSALTFATGAALPLLLVLVVPESGLVPAVAGISLACLALLGGLAAHAGGARVHVAAFRVVFWGALAMGLTAGIGALFGTTAS